MPIANDDFGQFLWPLKMYNIAHKSYGLFLLYFYGAFFAWFLEFDMPRPM